MQQLLERLLNLGRSSHSAMAGLFTPVIICAEKPRIGRIYRHVDADSGRLPSHTDRMSFPCPKPRAKPSAQSQKPPVSPQTPRARPKKSRAIRRCSHLDLLIYLALLLATFAVYAQVRHFDFVNYDDPDYTTGNVHVRQGLTTQGLEWALTSRDAANWFPVTWVSHMLDAQFFGLDSGWDHLHNVLLHALAAILLFIFLQRATGTRWRSALVAFLFALHPLHVESVAWVAERKDVLSACFWFLTLWAYVRYTERPGWGRYLAVVLGLCLGLMAKPMVVTLPFVLLLLDYWPLASFAGAGPQSHLGKAPAARAFGRGRRHHLPRAGTRRRGESCAARNPPGKRDAFLRDLYLRKHSGRRGWRFSILIRASFAFLPLLAAGASVGRRHHRRDHAAPPFAVPADGLGLVRGHACSGHRAGAGGRPGPRRPLHVHSHGGPTDHAGVGCGGDPGKVGGQRCWQSPWPQRPAWPVRCSPGSRSGIGATAKHFSGTRSK